MCVRSLVLNAARYWMYCALAPGIASPEAVASSMAGIIAGNGHFELAPLGAELHARLKEFYEQEVAAHIRGPY